MKAAIIIPARMGSTRFPGKPLVKIAGHALIYWVWRNAMRVGVPVLVASADQEILDYATAIGARVVRANGENGTERCAAALQQIGGGYDIVVNWQGDAPLIPPAWAFDLIVRLRSNLQTEAATIGYMAQPHEGLVRIDRGDYPNTVMFSRCKPTDEVPVLAHAGIYAYRGDALRRYARLKPTDREISQGLEQLRFPGVWGIIEQEPPAIPIREVNYPDDLDPVAAQLGRIYETV